MPTYNGVQHIDQAICSVLAQRGVPLELLIGDDVSTDGTWDRIRAYRMDPRVRAWRFRRRRGPGGNPNRIWMRARGKYLSICEQDDLMLPGNLRRLSAVLDRSPKIGVVCGPRLVLDERGGVNPEKRFLPDRSPAWDLLRMQIPHAGTLIRRSAMRQIGGYQESLTRAADCDLFLRLAEVARFHRLSGRPVYLYRKWSGSESNRRCSLLEQRRVVQKILSQTLQRRYGVRARTFYKDAPAGGRVGRRKTV